MIQGIHEVNFGAGTSADYATLHEATVTLVDMGERTITTQVRIDGDVIPSFDGWELEFKGERFVLPIKEPQASKDNTTRNSLVDLTFRSWIVEELKRYFYFQPAAINASTAIADQYQASVKMKLSDFVANFNSVLNHYWPDGNIEMLLDAGAATDTNLYLVEIDHAKIWEVLTKFYETFNKRWSIRVVNGVYQIRVGFDPEAIEDTDHTFQYGYEGGLLRFERQVQDEDITNVLLGRGGEKNLPYRYFKLLDPNNESFHGDPDAIPELANIYFDRLHDANFRWYVRGWMHNPNRDTSGDAAWDPGHVFPTYSITSSSPYYWAYRKGLTDEKFDPVEYVKDDDSIAKYGEHWGALDDNDDIFPTIQGRAVNPYGRIDESVAFSEITTDDIKEASASAAVELSIDPMLYTFYPNRWERSLTGNIVLSEPFVVPQGKTALVRAKWVDKVDQESYKDLVHVDTAHSTLSAVSSGHTDEGSIGKGDVLVTITEAGEYRLRLSLAVFSAPAVAELFTGTFGLTEIVVTLTDAADSGWAPTFDVWVKNIWNTTIGYDENGNAIPKETVGAVITEGGIQYTVTQALAEQNYAERVWLPILGDRLGNEAKMVFTSGMLSISSDYEFTIVSLPVHDESKTLPADSTHGIDGGVSHWRITLAKSDAEYQSLGVYIPSERCYPSAGDKFFFIGIDMPHYYVVLAEEKLNTYKQSQLSGFADIAPTWVVALDKVRVHTEEQADQYGILADRLNTGMRIRLSDPRFAANGLDLFIQSLTYKWSEPTNEQPYIVPDIEVVLSDKVVSQVGAVSRLQGQVNSIQSEYVRADQVEDTVRRIASAMYLKKTGESDNSDSPTTFASKVTSQGFREGGVGGEGWGIFRSNTASITEINSNTAPASDATAESPILGDAVIEADRVIVRKELQVNTLVVNQIEARGGKEILSAAKMEVSKVIFNMDGDGLYRLYFDQKQGSVENLFQVGDIALCQRYASNWDSTPTKYYKMVVEETHPDHIALLAYSNDGSGVPAAGDVVVQYGSVNNTSRQYVIVRDVINGGYERMLSGLTCHIDSDGYFYSPGVEYFFAGKENNAQPRWFVGSRILNQYIEYANGHLTIMGSASIGDVAGSTLLKGDLIQTGEISLGKEENNQFNVYAGISGAYSDRGIAAWFGGPKVDHESSAALAYARSLFRFDGSGYLASGNIKWNAAGAGSIPGISWDGNTIVIDSDVKFRNVGNELVGLVDSIKTLSNMFTLEGAGTQLNPYRIKALYSLYSVSALTALGPGSSSGGGGGSSTLAGLNDVTITSPQNGQVLKYNGTRWVNGEGGTASAGTLNTNNATALPVSSSESLSGAVKLHKVAKTGSYTDLLNKPTIPSAPGTLNTNNTTAQTVSSSESLSGAIKLHKVAKTGSYSDLLNKPDLSVYALASALNSYVTLTTEQTISGQKTFSATVNITSGMLQLRGLSAVANDGQGTFVFNQGNIATSDFRAGTAHKFYVNDTQKFEVNANRVRAWVPISPAWALGQNLGESGVRWGKLFCASWYPTSASSSDAATPHIEYDSQRSAFKIVGNLYATGFITALQAGSGSNPVWTVSGDIVPTQTGYKIGSQTNHFGSLYVDAIGDASNKVANAYVATLRSTDISNSGTITSEKYAGGAVVWGTDEYPFENLLDVNSPSSHLLSTYDITTQQLADIVSGSKNKITFYGNETDIYFVTEAHYSGGLYTIYFGRKYRLVQTSSTRFTVYSTLN